MNHRMTKQQIPARSSDPRSPHKKQVILQNIYLPEVPETVKTLQARLDKNELSLTSKEENDRMKTDVQLHTKEYTSYEWTL